MPEQAKTSQWAFYVPVFPFPFQKMGSILICQVELQIGLKDYDTQRDKRFAGQLDKLERGYMVP